jgi:hypothetical protein
MQRNGSNKACNVRVSWSEHTDWDTVCKRAAGRGHYNSVRKFRAELRRLEVARLLRARGALFDRGTQAALARQLGVSRSTISRDVAVLLRTNYPCPRCGALTTPPPTVADACAEPDGGETDEAEGGIPP